MEVLESIELNKVYCSDCVEGMKQIPDNSIDLAIFSPPYDNTRKYEGYSFDLHETGKQLFRILKIIFRIIIFIKINFILIIFELKN